MTHYEIQEKILEYIKTIPALPASINKVMELCNNINVNPAELNHVISLDPVLVGRVLKLLNSSYYGIGPHVTSLVRAIIMLGLNTVKNLALSSAIMCNLPINKNQKGLNMENFWLHSLYVGVNAKLLAKKKGVEPKMLEEYFTTGLLHDIGKIPINAVFSADYLDAVIVSEEKQCPLFIEEKENFGVNHSETGAMISQAWKLQGPIADTIAYHHTPDQYKGEYEDIVNTVAIANYFTVLANKGFAGDRFPEKPINRIWSVSRIEETAYDEIAGKADNEISKAKIFLRLI